MLNLRPKSRPQRVVLIGGSGFIGKNVATLLAQKEVPSLVISSKEIDLSATNACDLLNEKLRDSDTVVFLSCLTPDKGKDENAFLKNIQMARSFCAIDNKINLGHFIYISSDAVYNLDQSPIREDITPAPTDLYGVMHLSREIIFKEFCARRKLDFCILRPVAVYGEGDTHNSYGPNRFRKMLEKENKITLFGTGADKRDHIFIQDLAKIIVLALEHKAQGTLNVASGKSLSFLDVAQAVVTARGTGSIEFAPNNATPTNKFFDNAALIKSFPDFHFQELAKTL